MGLRSYTVNYFEHIWDIDHEEAVEFNKPLFWGIKPIDLVPIAIWLNLIMDVAQLFVPKWRLR
jgi:hypothetical protein